MAEILYRLGGSIFSAGLLSAMFCFAVFCGRSLFFCGSLRADDGFESEWPKFNYSWFKLSLVALLGGYILTKAALVANPELASATRIELTGPAGETAKAAGDILLVVFYTLLSGVAVMIVDAMHRPERGLGRYWPKVSRFLFLAYQFAESRTAEREEKVWPKVIKLSTTD